MFELQGLGNQFEVSTDKIIPDESISIEKGDISIGRRRVIKCIEVIVKRYNFSLQIYQEYT